MVRNERAAGGARRGCKYDTAVEETMVNGLELLPAYSQAFNLGFLLERSSSSPASRSWLRTMPLASPTGAVVFLSTDSISEASS